MRRISLLSIMLLAFISAFASVQAEIQTILVHSKAFGMKLSPDGQTVATYENGVIHNDEVFPEFLPIRLFDVSTGAEKAALTGHMDYAIDVAFSHDSKTLVSLHFNGMLYVWDIESGTLVREIPSVMNIAQAEFLSDGKTLVLLVNNPYTPSFLLLDVETGYITGVVMQRFDSRHEFMEFTFEFSSPDFIAGFDVSPDGQSVVLVRASGDILRWNLADSSETILIDEEDLLPRLYIRDIQVSADGTLALYTHIDDERIYVIDTETGEQKAAIPAKTRTAALADDGETVAWLDESGAINVVSLSQPDIPPTVIPLPVKEGMTVRGFPMLFFTPDSSKVVVGGMPNIDNADNAIFVVSVK